jgi:hypothetical protein
MSRRTETAYKDRNIIVQCPKSIIGSGGGCACAIGFNRPCGRQGLHMRVLGICNMNATAFMRLCFAWQNNQWRYVRTRIRNLLKMGIHPNVAIPMSFSRKAPGNVPEH